MSKFQGVIVPIVTPFNRDDAQTINYEAGEKLVEKVIAAGADGIFTFGSNGEFFVCSADEKIEFSKFVIEKVAGRVPVYLALFIREQVNIWNFLHHYLNILKRYST